MSFKIYDSNNALMFEYYEAQHGYNFHSTPLQNDVLGGIRVPISLQSTFGNKNIVFFPQNSDQVELFARAYKLIIFDRELVKHGFYLRYFNQ